ncbi:hypothetical protein [Paenibacillus camerounensis]|uniref:hypothetical protein n=1 Tax=Paenibacillus camerounensis TaxID=1243663 RepID=UPI000AC566FB|nr:hypothetical protein [Paenibacillus camerounensis]
MSSIRLRLRNGQYPEGTVRIPSGSVRDSNTVSSKSEGGRERAGAYERWNAGTPSV